MRSFFCATIAVMIFHHQIWYPPRQSMRTLHIYLPPYYDSEKERYPVMYMFDGQNLFHDEEATFGRSWRLEWFADHWQKKIIIVGMECSHTGDERLEEYCPWKKRWKGIWHEGIGEKTFAWITDDVKPWVDSNLRTYSHREATGIGGSSMGGIMALYGILAHNDIFSKAACVSTGIFWNMHHFEDTLRQNYLDQNTRIYMSWGEQEAGRAAYGRDPAFDTREARAVRKMEREIQERGARTFLYFQRGGRHCEEDWEQQNPVYMNWLWCEK